MKKYQRIIEALKAQLDSLPYPSDMGDAGDQGYAYWQGREHELTHIIQLVRGICND